MLHVDINKFYFVMIMMHIYMYGADVCHHKKSLIINTCVFLPATYKIMYVNMQVNYVNMQRTCIFILTCNLYALYD